MKKFLKFMPLLLVMFFSLNTTQVKAIDNFEINDLNVLINVNEDGTYDITEDYTLNFTSPALGIYRDLIVIQDMVWIEDGKETRKTYNFPVTDINVEGDVFYVESQFNGKRIVIGPDDGPRFTGEKEYRVSYTVHSKPIDLEVQKEAFFQNLVSDWSASMHNFSATVNFYDKVDLSELQVKGESYQGEFEVPCTVNSNQSFTCTYNQEVAFGSGKGITALLPLSDDYFTRASSNYIYYVGLVSAVVVLLVSSLLWAIYGKDDPVVEVVSFNPPKGFNSAMVGYVYDDTVDNDDLYSLLFYWANQGLIQIKEEKASKLEFTKLKEIPNDTLAFEKELFSIMFYKDGPITTSDWQKRDLYTKLLMSKNKVASAVRSQGKIYTSKSKNLRSLIVMIGLLPLAYVIFASVNFNVMSILLAALFAGGTVVIYIFAFAIFDGFQKKNRHKKGLVFLSSVLFIAIMIGLLFIASVLSNTTLGSDINVIYVVVISIMTTITMIIAHFMKKRSEFGSKIYGEVLGLRAFIKYAKRDELVVMQEANPYLYYDVLPYAYAFGMSDLWNTQFKTIEIPQSPYYTTYRSSGFTTYLLMNSMLRSVNQVPTQVIPKVKSGSGGASFGGGGFSGGGGGFSGGGGFGGGGGGGR